MAVYNERGEEMPDPTPHALTVGFKRPPSLIEMIRAQVLRSTSDAAREQGFETFEESEDFDVPDDELDPHSRWEYSADDEDVLHQVQSIVKRKSNPPPPQPGAGGAGSGATAAPASPPAGSGSPPAGSPAGVSAPAGGSPSGSKTS